jgi:DedD protein
MVDALVKERLTGAIILVALIVLLVPELLSGPIRPAPRARGPVSTAEEPPLRAITINLADEAHGGNAALQPQAPTPLAPAAEAAGAASAPQPATNAAGQSAAAAPPAAPPRAAAAPAGTPLSPQPATAGARGGWMVQLGSFANRANAEHLAEEVRGRGFQAAVSRGSTGRRLYRVRVGPVHDRQAAEQLAARLRTAGHGGSIVPQ